MLAEYVLSAVLLAMCTIERISIRMMTSFDLQIKYIDEKILSDIRAHISGRQTPCLTRGSPPLYITNAGGKLRVKPGVWRPEMWALLMEQRLP
jgi:hypothetical protein